MSQKFAFERGYNEVPLGQAEEAKQELMKIFNISSRPAWLRRLRGEVKPKVDEYEAVEQVLARYGVPKSKVWGEYNK